MASTEFPHSKKQAAAQVAKLKKMNATAYKKKKPTAKKMTDAELRAKAVAAYKAGGAVGKAPLKTPSKSKGTKPKAKPKAKPKKNMKSY